MTTRFTSFAKVKVIVKAEIAIAVVSHPSFFFVLRCKVNTFLAFCQENGLIIYTLLQKVSKSL